MSWFQFELVLILLGFVSAALLYHRIPRLPQKRGENLPRVSVIIPARNEAQTLPLLLSDLRAQTFAPLEILVADDNSEDETAQTARVNGAKILTLSEKPADWIGKSWACQKAAEAATGDVFVFLDADVRLSPEGLFRIVSAFSTSGTLSVQPYHTPKRAYEHLAILFNIVQVGANGTALPKPCPRGLFGPVIAISRADYFAAGGHESVRGAIVEDMALAERLRREKIPFSAYIGDADVSFRMYPSGFLTLWQGFAKNIGTSASKTPFGLFLLVALFLTSVISSALNLIVTLVRTDPLALLYGVFYVFWVWILFRIGRQVGRFSPLTAIFYPVPLSVFLLFFAHSSVLRVFRGKVKWKGRAIRLEW